VRFLSVANTAKLAILAGFGSVVLGLGGAGAVAQDEYSIRVEPHQVIVPTFVFLQDIMTSLSQKERVCRFTNAETFYKLRLSDSYQPIDCDETVMRDLNAADFKLFEDGAEQKIQDVTLQRVAIVNARDSAGWHIEYSYTPQGKWSTSDLGPLLVPGDTGYRDSTGWHPGFYYAPHSEWNFTGVRYGPGSAGFFYRIAYVPPKSEEGSCHKVRVGVNRPNASVFARREYCNVKHAPSDPLEDTKLGDRLQGYAAAGRKGGIPVSLQAAVLHTDANHGRVDVALSFPWYRLWREWREGTLFATIGVLGMVYDKDGILVMRFTDFGCCSQERPDFLRGKRHAKADPDRDKSLIPTRYEAQLDLPPGDYKLRMALTDGHEFGLADSLFTVEPYDSTALTVSSVVLCDRFRDAVAAQKEDETVVIAPSYESLVSKGAQFAMAADTRLRPGNRLFAYFEVRDPLVMEASTQLHMQLKIAKLKHGQVEVDTGLRDISTWVQPGSPVIHVAEEIDANKLSLGSYRLEVQVSDSAGRTSPWRSATFTVE